MGLNLALYGGTLLREMEMEMEAGTRAVRGRFSDQRCIPLLVLNRDELAQAYQRYGVSPYCHDRWQYW